MSNLVDFQIIYSNGDVSHLIQENNEANKEYAYEHYLDEKDMSVVPWVVGTMFVNLPKNARFKKGYENIKVMYCTRKDYDCKSWQEDEHIEIKEN